MQSGGQPKKGCRGKCGGRVNFFRKLQPRNAILSIFSTEWGIVRLARALKESNARLPIEVKESGSTRVVSERQNSNAPSSISVTVFHLILESTPQRRETPSGPPEGAS